MAYAEIIREMEERGIKAYAERLRKWGKGYDEIALNIRTIQDFPVDIGAVEEAFKTWKNPYPKRYQRTLKKANHRKPARKGVSDPGPKRPGLEDEYRIFDKMKLDIKDSLEHGYTLKQIRDRIERITKKRTKYLERYIIEELKMKADSGIHESADFFNSRF